MRLRLATKFSWSILGIVVLSIVSSGVAWYVAWRVNRRLELNARIALPDVRVEEMEMLFHQRSSLIAAYLLDGNAAWLKRLDQLQPRFREWIDAVRHAGQVPPEEASLLTDLQSAWNDFDARQSETLSLYKQNQIAQAKSVLLGQIDGRIAERIDGLSGKLIDSINRNIRASIARADWRIHLATWVVIVSGILSLGLGAWLLWLLYYRVLFPLRGIVADARIYRGESESDRARSPEDELHLMGLHLRNLMSDVSDTRSRLAQSRDRLAAAEKLASVGRLAASVAHEIRNPLTAIKMWLFSIHEATRGDSKLDRKLGIVSEEIGRLENIVRHFLEFSRPPAIRPQPLEIQAAICQTLELLRPRLAEARVCVENTCPAELPLAMADAEGLKQVLLNLVGNAIDAMPGGGELRIRASAETGDDAAPMVVVRIGDSGSGMSEEVQWHVFEPFFTTKDTGTGLGLCIAAQVMARHGGALILESSSASGTTFAVWIPAALENVHGKNSGR
jgi:signal transduction histidine kinase